MSFAFLKPDGFPEEGDEIIRHFLEILGEYDIHQLKELLNHVSNASFQEGVNSVIAQITAAARSVEESEVVE